MSSRLASLAAELANQLRNQLQRSELGRTLAQARAELARGRNPQRLLKAAEAMAGRGGLSRLLTSTQISQVVARAKKEARSSGNEAGFREIVANLGPVGQLVEQLVGAGSGTRRQGEREILRGILGEFGFSTDVGRSTLEAMGFKVAGKPKPKPELPKTTKRGTPRKVLDVDFGGGKKRRFKIDSPVITGDMVKVTSSNVHSIGFDIDWNNPRSGTLKVRFLGGGSGPGMFGRVGPGPLYHYHDVPTEMFEDFMRSASKGGWVWDELRIRGTVSGRQFEYNLAGTGPTGYVPRQATLRRKDQEWFMQREFADESGQIRRSRLPNQFVKFYRPDTGAPNRGAPNRGKGRRP